MYSEYYTAHNPGLWVILTDESDESTQVINDVISSVIKLNFTNPIKNRCYIHLIGYNGSVKVIKSGHLEEFHNNPIRIEEAKRFVSDGEGGRVEMRIRKSIWVDPYIVKQKSKLSAAIVAAHDFITKEFVGFRYTMPAPVVFNIFKEVTEDPGLTMAIRQLTEIKVQDGELLFVNGRWSASKEILLGSNDYMSSLSSKFPKSVDFLYRFIGIMRDTVDLSLINSNTNLNFNTSHLGYWFMRTFLHIDYDETTDAHLYEQCKRHINSLHFQKEETDSTAKRTEEIVITKREKMNHSVFISYSRADKEKVYEICEILKENNIPYWIDKGGILSGENYKAVIVDAIQAAKVIIFASSKNSNTSKNVIKEIGYAAGQNKIIIPIKLDDAPYAKSIALDIWDTHQIEFKSLKQAKNELITGLAYHLEIW